MQIGENSISYKKLHFYLNRLEGGPLKLYLYFAFVANNKNGHSWHSISTIATYFDAQTRTIDNWIKVLVDEGLIYRQRAGKKSNTTYLVPFSHGLNVYRQRKQIKTDSQELLNACLVDLKKLESVYGEVFSAFHFFQWNAAKTKKITNQALFVLSKRKEVITVTMISLANSEDMVISEENVEEIMRFDSPFILNGNNVVGLVYPDEPSFTAVKTGKHLLDTLVELAETEQWQFEEIPLVEYGNIDTLFPEEDEDEDEDEPQEETE